MEYGDIRVVHYDTTVEHCDITVEHCEITVWHCDYKDCMLSPQWSL